MAAAQCTTIGQTPSSAFPVCGTTVFTQNTVPACSNGNVPASSCGPYEAVNPFFYKFTCYVAGTLQFIITPNDLGDDYDWQLFDMTNATSPDEIYANEPGLFVVGNWSGTYGKTGAAPGHQAVIVCASEPNKSDPFSLPPLLKAGHNYLLLVSHYTPSQSGYSLSFSGGTAIITDPNEPALKTAVASCGGNKIGVAINKSVKCLSLAADGSDFRLSTPLAKITGATGVDCNSGFDMDSLVLTLSQPLPPGSYKIFAQTGSDRNTLLDNCGIPLATGDSIGFTVYDAQPTPMDSMAAIAQCAAQNLTLVFRKNIACSSIAADGSDFVINGPQAVTVKKVAGNCDENGLTHTITVTFSAPITTGGTYTITLVKGSDGNTILDECTQETPAGSSLTFNTSSSVSPLFSSQLKLGCKQDTLVLMHDGNGNANFWEWSFDDGVRFIVQNVTRIYNDYGTRSAKLVVSNGVCTDSSSQDFVLNNRLKAGFSSPAVICPEDKAIYVDSSIGKIAAWKWNFGNGYTSTAQNPPPQGYQQSTADKNYLPQLVVLDSVGCYDTAYGQLKVIYTCYIAVATAFTPNGDGLNDYLYPLNAYKAVNLQFKVFNRWGQQVFETRDWTNRWDGTVKGIPQAAGTYVWMLSYTDVDTKQQHFLRGTSVLIR